jgi:acetyltransferase
VRGKSVAVLTPLLASTTDYGRAVRAKLPSVPVLRETERTLRVLKALADAGSRPLHAGAFLVPPSDADEARRWRARAAKFNAPTALSEVESKALLRAYGIATPQERLVQTGAQAEEAAEEIGFPVVLKGVCAAIAHKSDAGLVVLGLHDAAAVRAAAAALAEQAEKLDVQLAGILVAQQITGGVETVLGISRDVEMGPVVMFGMGGVWLELFKDVAFAPATLDRAQALAMVNATRAGTLIAGYRGAPAGDLDALIDAVLNLGRLARDLGDIIEAVDINPLMVCERGAFALDGLVVLRPSRN